MVQDKIDSEAFTHLCAGCGKRGRPHEMAEYHGHIDVFLHAQDQSCWIKLSVDTRRALEQKMKEIQMGKSLVARLSR